MTAIVIGAILAGVQLVIEGAKYAVKKTKTTKDDKVVDFIAKHEAEVLAYLKAALEKQDAKPAPRPQVVDHRK
jgi:hypothetical protein